MSDVPYDGVFPQSRKVFIEGTRGVRVPMREIAISTGETLRVYDSSGPQAGDPRAGLPAAREDWVRPRRGQRVVTQMHYARTGEITPEMEFVAIREGLDADFVRAEVARG